MIAEQEHAGEPLMSQDFLSQVIRSYGGAMQNVVGSYLEQSLKLLSSQQQQIREHLRGSMGTDAYDAISDAHAEEPRALALGAGRHLQGDERRRQARQQGAENEEGRDARSSPRTRVIRLRKRPRLRAG